MALNWQLFFNQGQTGWSETYYSAHDFDATTPFSTLLAGMRTFRLPLSSTGVVLSAIRISDVANPRKVFVSPGTSGAPFSFPTVPSNADPDMPFTSALIRWSLDSGGKRITYLRGLSDALTHAKDGKITDATWVSAFQAFRNWQIANSFGGYARTPGQALRPIADIFLVDGKIRLSADTTGLTLPTYKMRISRLVSDPPLNGVWRAKVIGLDVLELEGSNTTRTNPPAFEAGGTITTLSVSFGFINGGDQTRFTTHRVGRPFGLLRSRRRKVKPRLPYPRGEQ